MWDRGVRYCIVLVFLAVLASACGARVTEQQIQAAGGSGGGPGAFSTGGGGGGDGGGGGASDTPDGDATGPSLDPAATGSGGSGPAGGGPAASGDDGGEGQAPAAPAASAEGNGGATDVGVTATEVLLGNVSTLSGPVPGLFQGAVIGAQAVVAYQNSKGGLFGRKFKLEARDDQFDTGQNRAQTTELASKVFAFLGSFSLYDDAGVDAMRKTGIPDFSVPLNQSRGDLPTNASVAPFDMRGAPTGPFEWFKAKFPEAVQSMGTIWGDVPAAKASHLRFKAAAESVGWNYVYDRGYQATETDFTADVIRMRQNGVKGVFLIATDDKTTARFAKAMQQQGFEPEFFSANYMPTLVPLGGAAVENIYSTSPFALFGGEDASINPEVKLFMEWYRRVRPGATPDLFGVYSWAEGRLLFQAMEAAGPKATRADVLREMKKITPFSAGDLIGPASPGAKEPSKCYVVAQLRGGRYHRVDPAKGYRCDGTYFRR